MHGAEDFSARADDAPGTGPWWAQMTRYHWFVLLVAALGWLFDKMLGTSPWGLIVFLILGFCAGVLNVLRSAGLIAVSKSERGFDIKPSGKDETPKGNAWADDEED